MQEEIQKMRRVIKNQIEDANNFFIEDMHSRNIIPLAYPCELCGNTVISEQKIKVIPGVTPRCMACLGNITITKRLMEEA